MSKATFKNGVRLYRSRRYDAALTEFMELGEDPALNLELSYYLGLCYTQLERYEESLIFLEQVVTMDNNLLHIYQSRMILSYIYAKTGRYKLAEFELDSLLTAGYESAQVYAAYAFIAYSTRQFDDAITFLKKALDIDPDNANAQNSLGFILAERGKDLDLALTLCRKALRQKPDSPAYLDSLGWVYYKMGNFREARNQLRRALNLAGGNKDIAGHMKAAMKSE